MMDQVLKEIEQRNAFLLTSHARPDGDAIGSLLALYQTLKQIGKRARVIMSDAVPLIYNPLPFANVIEHLDMPLSCLNATALNARAYRDSKDVFSSTSITILALANLAMSIGLTVARAP